MIVRTPKSWLKTIYISARGSPTKVSGNQTYPYSTPIPFEVNHQPISASSDIEIFGANSSQIQKAMFLSKPYPNINEYDKAYLDGIVPTGEGVIGEKANYRVARVLIQNEAMVVYFEKLPGLENARI